MSLSPTAITRAFKRLPPLLFAFEDGLLIEFEFAFPVFQKELKLVRVLLNKWINFFFAFNERLKKQLASSN